MPIQNNRYSSAEVSRMRQDAIRRTQEMQRRASSGNARPYQQQGRAGSRPQERPKNETAPPKNIHRQEKKEEKTLVLPSGSAKEENKNVKNPLEALMTQFHIDKDRAIVLLMLFILLREHADNKLILALCYLLF